MYVIYKLTLRYVYYQFFQRLVLCMYMDVCQVRQDKNAVVCKMELIFSLNLEKWIHGTAQSHCWRHCNPPIVHLHL